MQYITNQYFTEESVNGSTINKLDETIHEVDNVTSETSVYDKGMQLYTTKFNISLYKKLYKIYFNILKMH